MIKVQFIKSTPEDYLDEELILELIFPGSTSKFDSFVDDSVYHYVLHFDSIYNFTENDYNGPMIDIIYLDGNDNIIEVDDCMDYMYNL